MTEVTGLVGHSFNSPQVQYDGSGPYPVERRYPIGNIMFAGVLGEVGSWC